MDGIRCRLSRRRGALAAIPTLGIFGSQVKASNLPIIFTGSMIMIVSKKDESK